MEKGLADPNDVECRKGARSQGAKSLLLREPRHFLVFAQLSKGGAARHMVHNEAFNRLARAKRKFART
jgi:hypothetical protein